MLGCQPSGLPLLPQSSPLVWVFLLLSVSLTVLASLSLSKCQPTLVVPSQAGHDLLTNWLW